MQEAELINLTRPKYSELDLEKIKNEYQNKIEYWMNQYNELKKINTLHLKGSNINCILTPNIETPSYTMDICIRDVSFKIGEIKQIHRDLDPKYHIESIQLEIIPNDYNSEQNIRKCYGDFCTG
jgi:hypothetical protein